MTSVPALIPALTPESNRHKRPWKDNSRTPLVPLWTKDARGDEIEGRIVVPLRLCFTQEHTNERLEFKKLIDKNLRRWSEWRLRRGWILNSRPRVTGPFNPPTSGSANADKHWERAKKVIGAGKDIHEVTDFAHAEEVRIFVVKAFFKRETPVYQKLEDVLYLRHLSEIYSRPEPSDSGWVNPLVHAEQRRQRLGLKREDYLLGPLSQPL